MQVGCRIIPRCCCCCCCCCCCHMPTLQALLLAKADATLLTSDAGGRTGALFVCTEVGSTEVFAKIAGTLDAATFHAAANQKNGEGLYALCCSAVAIFSRATTTCTFHAFFRAGYCVML